MAEYLLTNNYEKLLIDTNTSTDFIPKYISGLNHPGFTRYFTSSKNKKYTVKKSYLYKLLEGEEININWAAVYGHLELVKYLYKGGSAVQFLKTMSCSVVKRYATSKDNVVTTSKTDRPKPEATKLTIDRTTDNGHLEAVKYPRSVTLYKQGGSAMSCNVDRPKPKATEWAIDRTAEEGHLEVVKYLYKQGLEVTENGIDMAAKEGHLEVVKYLRSVTLYNQELEVTETGVNWAAKYGHLEVVKYLYGEGLEATQDGIDGAAHYGHLEVIKYLYSEGLEASEDGIDWAARNGHLEVVKYLYSEGLKATKDGINWAAEDGHLEVVKYILCV